MAEVGEGPKAEPKDIVKDVDDVPNPGRRLFLGRVARAAGVIAARRLLPPTILTGMLGHAESHDRSGEPVYELPPLPEFKSPDQNQKVLVIPLLEQGEKEPLSAERLETLFLNLAGSKFKTDSYGKINYSFKVLPWDFVDLPNDRDRTGDVAAIGDARLVNSGISELDQYQTRMYVLLSDSDTKAGGYGEKRKPTTYNRAWIYANESVGIGLDDVIRHELGHTLGMPHANSVDVRGRHVKEYGGILDPWVTPLPIGLTQ